MNFGDFKKKQQLKFKVYKKKTQENALKQNSIW